MDHAWAGHGGFDGNGVADFGSRSYLVDLPRFVTPDRGDFGSAADPQSLNRYAYGRGNPYRYVDPSGNVIETAWDIANLGMGVVSLVANAAAGNWGGAALDAVGLVADATATVDDAFLTGVEEVRAVHGGKYDDAIWEALDARP